MQQIKDSVYRLTNHMQGVISHIEDKKPKEALVSSKSAILELHRIMAAIAANTMTSITSEDTTELHRVATELALVTAELHLITTKLAASVSKTGLVKKPGLVKAS